MRNGLALLLLIGTPPLSAQWRVDPKPTISIGASDQSGSELLKVSSARRFSDGRIVVANGDPRDIRIFGGDGRLLSHFGRSGEGPGEFGYAINLIATNGDSILVWDVGKRRSMLFQSDGHLLKETTFPSGLVNESTLGVFRRTLARMRPGDQNSCVMQAIEALPQAPIPAVRELFADEGWRIWTRENGGTTWAIHNVSGRSLGSVTMPAGFEILEAGKDFVLGRTTDAEGFDHVQLFGATLPPAQSAPPRCISPPRDTMPLSRVAFAAMRTDMRNGMSAFEAFYAANHRYPASVQDLKGMYTMSSPYEGAFVVTRVGAGAYSFAIFDKKSTAMCIVAVGDGIPAAWPNGTLMCGW